MRRLLYRLWILFVILVGIPALLWIAGFVIYVGSVASMREPSNVTQTDAIIVLTGGSNRVDRGLDLLVQGKAGNILISGVHRDVKMDELLKLRGYDTRVKTAGLENRIILGRQASTTLGNANEARQWILDNHIRSVRLITANYHMPRAMVEFRQVLPSLTIEPHPVQPDDFSIRTPGYWRLAVNEYHKLIASLGRIFLFLAVGPKQERNQDDPVAAPADF